MALCGWLMLLAGGCQKPFSWAIDYSAATRPYAFSQYSLVVVDRLYPYALAPLKEKGVKVVGYVSLGEVKAGDPWFEKAKAAGLVLAENPYWKGSYTVDIRKPEWQAIVLGDILPELVSKQFDGFMFDTLDSPLAQEAALPGMKAAAISLVWRIRNAYPKQVLIQNRGYTVLPEVAAALDYVLAESTFTDYDTAKEVYRHRDTEGTGYILKYIKQAQMISPRLQVLGLEYWNPEDHAGKQQIIDAMRLQGFFPYISTPKLDRIHPQPL